MTVGALLGAGTGAGVGYLTAPKPELRRRGALVGAGVGAGTGALMGGIAGETPEADVGRAIDSAVDRASKLYYEAGKVHGRMEIAGRLKPGMNITPELKANTIEDIAAQAAPITKALTEFMQSRKGVT